jgi:ribosomal protein RSM22 (predicted rRNA methylase)
MRQLRADLIAAGGHVLAPCPHEHACPMTENDWCHFAARVERSALHRKLKAASLGYEDEKYSYLVMAKQPVKSASARILRHPQVNSGFVKLQLCTPNGLQNLTVTRSDKEAFKQARKADWGDDWE